MMRQPPASNIPPYPTPFVGREAELGDLAALLADPGCRLITLLGPGGIGKTRLACEAATLRASSFDDGACFVPLQSLSSPDLLVSAIADALELPLSGQEEPAVQLCRYLGGKQVLLVLDNFEQLLPASGLLAQILVNAPAVRLLVTSREALSLQEEWLYPVAGLRFPSQQDLARLEDYDAVRLFVEHARRGNRDFSAAAEADGLMRICESLEGIPLGIELAASWLRVLSCSEIADEIQRGVDFLESNYRNVPDRHRSMRAVFEESWKLIDEGEREVFRKLSVFQGDFTRDAAEKVAGASLRALSAIADKSLIKPLPNGRYHIHELLRQFAFSRLEESSEEMLRTRQAHCAYFVDFLASNMADAMNGQQVSATARVEDEPGNIRAAWQWVVEHGSADDLRRGGEAIFNFWSWKSRYVEAATALEQSVARLAGMEPSLDVEMTLAATMQHLSWFYIRLGLVDKAREAALSCQRIYRDRHISPPWGWVTDPQLPMGVIALIRGQYEEAASLGGRARALAETQRNPRNLEVACYVTGMSEILQGRFVTARDHMQRACDTARKAQDRWFMAYALLELGNIASALGDYEAASAHCRAGYEIKREFRDPQGMAIALVHLGETACRQQSYAEALDLCSQSLALYRDLGDRGGLATAHCGVARAAAALGDFEAAKAHYPEALDLAASVQHTQLLLLTVAHIGVALISEGMLEKGQTLLSLASLHPSSSHEARSVAEKALAGLVRDSRPQASGERGGADAQRAVAILQEYFGRPFSDIESLLREAPAPAGQPSPHSSDGVQAPDGLTEREVEVLRLIVDGKTNPQIAKELFISVKTVGTHVSNILAKTGASSRSEAAVYAVRRGIV